MKPGKPLKRTSPLTAKTGLRRSTPIARQGGRESLSAREQSKSKSAPKRKAVDVGPSAEVVDAVVSRDRESCLICGRGLGPNERGRYWSVHHRLRRAQQVQHTVENCIVLCGGAQLDGCHQVVHANPEASRQGGWLLRGRQHPLAVPVLIPLENRLVYLTSTGLYHDVRPEVA